MADHRQHPVGLDELPERVEEGEEQHPEADHREPVRDRHDRQPRHPRVAEELAQQGPRALARVVRARVGLAEPEDAQEVPHRLGHQGDGHRGDGETDDERDDLQGRHGVESTDR